MISLEHIWSVNEQNLNRMERLGLGALKRLVITWECINKNHIMSYASALTYSSMLAAVPVLAIIFAIARGFGFDAIIETKLRSSLAGNPDIVDTILYFVDSYLQHTKGGVFIGIGLIFLLYTLLSLTSNVEEAFNTIWYVKRSRTISRKITDYISIFLFMPFIIVITSGLSIFLATFRTLLPDTQLLTGTMSFFLHVSPVIIAIIIFMLLFKMMPNTRVKWRHTIWPAILTGAAFMAVEWVYVHYQIKLSAYNAIYGSFAAIPLFMLWMQISWCICLLGAQLSYANQSLLTYAFERVSDELSRRYRDTLILLLMSRICKHFASGLKPFTAHRLAVNTHLPDSLVGILLTELTDMQLLVEVPLEQSDELHYLPAIDIHRITVGMVIRRIDSHGIENPSLVWQTGTPEWDMPSQYEYTLYADHSERWDFARFRPDVVCINLGTNDLSTNNYDTKLLKQGYKKLLGQVRSNNPQAKIVFLCGSMLKGKELEICKTILNEVTDEAHKAGDSQIYRFDFTPQDGALKHGADWHPSLWQHEKMAAELTAYLRTLMQWF